MVHMLYLCYMHNMRICIILNLRGDIVSGINFEFTSAERQKAIYEFEISLEPDVSRALREIEFKAHTLDTTQIDYLKAAKDCDRAATIWLELIEHKQINESRTMSILLAAKVIHFMYMGSSRLYQAIRSSDQPIDTYEYFLEMSADTCDVCVAVGKYETLQNIQNNIKTVRELMLKKFGEKKTESAFRKVYDSLFAEYNSNEAQLIFLEYSYNMQNIKHDFYNNVNPSKYIIELYKKYLDLKIDVAAYSNDVVTESAIRIEIDKMSKRELELLDKSYESNTSYAGDLVSSLAPKPTLRRRR